MQSEDLGLKPKPLTNITNRSLRHQKRKNAHNGPHQNTRSKKQRIVREENTSVTKNNDFYLDMIDDVFNKILKFFVTESGLVDAESTRNIMLVSKRWHQMASSKPIWQAAASYNSFHRSEKKMVDSKRKSNRVTNDKDHLFTQFYYPSQRIKSQLKTSLNTAQSLENKLIGFIKLKTNYQDSKRSCFKVKERFSGKCFLLKVSSHNGAFSPLKNEQKGVPNTLLREISATKHFDRSPKNNHDDIQKVSSKHLSLLRGMDISCGRILRWYDFGEISLEQFISKSCKNISMDKIKNMMRQILSGTHELHKCGLIHRNLTNKHIRIFESPSDKSNMLVKICKFSSSRGSTPLIVDKCMLGKNILPRPYRAPEIVSNNYSDYGTPVDIWAIGCLFVELILRKPLFLNKTCEEDLVHQIDILFGKSDDRLLGIELLNNDVKNKISFSEIFRYLDKNGINFLRKLLLLNPEKRITAKMALCHPFLCNHEPDVINSCLQMNSCSSIKMVHHQNLMSTNIPCSYLHHFESEDSCLNVNRNRIGESNWTILVDWVLEIITVFEKSTRVAFLAMSYFDKFLAKTKVRPGVLVEVKRTDVQLVAATCLHIASKVEDDSYIGVEDLVFCADKGFEEKEIILLETVILNRIYWEMSSPLIYDFVMLYFRNPKIENEKDTCFWLAMYISELALQSSLYIKFKNSIIAATVVALSRYSIGIKDTWTEQLETVSGYDMSQLTDCLKELSIFIDKRRIVPSLKIISRRYKKSKRHRVTEIPIKSVRHQSDLVMM